MAAWSHHEGAELSPVPQGRASTYTETVVACSVCGAKLNESELKRLRADTDFVEHGSPSHLIRVDTRPESLDEPFPSETYESFTDSDLEQLMVDTSKELARRQGGSWFRLGPLSDGRPFAAKCWQR
jgi:hypothetical protein